LNLCYLCGDPATKPLALKDTFTAHSSARVPDSDKMCDRCTYSINLRCWYNNPSKGRWGKLFSRNWSWLFQGETLLSPTIKGTYAEGGEALEIVSSLPTRVKIRGWLLNPPDPPFTIAIAESGQKHILFLAQEAHDRAYFPVQFELDTLYIDRAQFALLLQAYESLMALEFSKSEIDSGDYRSDRLMKCLEAWELLESAIAAHRGRRLLQLISYLAIRWEAPRSTCNQVSAGM